MDLQKTGALISRRRKELSMTQKQLAQQLNISDRTVSKWERGAGFPDLSLLEPLADALGFSVLELMHGERSSEPKPEAENFAREMVHSLRFIARTGLKKARRWICILSALLVCAAAVLIFLIVHPDRYFAVSSDEINAAQAVEICPFILITTKEYELRSKLFADGAITSRLTDDAIFTVDEDLTALYRDMVHINGSSPDTFRIDVIGRNIYVDLEHGSFRCILLFRSDGFVSKTCFEYGDKHDTSLSTKKVDYTVENCNNVSFTSFRESRDLLFPFLESLSSS